jgi:hypothetical protein
MVCHLQVNKNCLKRYCNPEHPCSRIAFLIMKTTFRYENVILCRKFKAKDSDHTNKPECPLAKAFLQHAYGRQILYSEWVVSLLRSGNYRYLFRDGTHVRIVLLHYSTTGICFKF